MNSIRIHNYFDEKSLLELLAGLESSPRLVHEVVFFSGYYHCPSPLTELRRRAKQIVQALQIVRAAGYRAGINHLSTLGHLDENLEASVDGTLQRLVGHNGIGFAQGTLCPANQRVRDYVRESYEIFASCHPDILWIDDDMRLAGLPKDGCFCDGCMAEFSAMAGELFTRESLVTALDDENEVRRRRIRRMVLERNQRVICGLLTLIEKTVHGIDPNIELGLMSGELFWEACGYAPMAEALRGNKNLPVRWRPGGGFYDDSRPQTLVDKAHGIGRQVSLLPSHVRVIQSEVENYPYQPLRKSMQSNVLEVTAYMFAGCTGCALNILSQEGNPVTENVPLLDRLKRAVPFWERLRDELAGTVPVGVWGAWDARQIAAGKKRDRPMFFGDDLAAAMKGPYALSDLGIPVCYKAEHGLVTALAGRMPHALGPERVKLALARGALLDAEALGSLEEMGLGHLAGVKLGRSFGVDTQEMLTDHPLNREFAGWKRDCRQSFRWWNVIAHQLIPLSKEVGELARISDYRDQDRGASLTIFLNEMGGRVAVMSYFPWTLNLGLGKRRQMTTLCDWLSREKMPISIETYARITPWVRRHEDGRLVIGLLNLTADTYDSVEIRIRTNRKTFQQLGVGGQLKRLGARRDGDSCTVSISSFQAFTFEVILVS